MKKAILSVMIFGFVGLICGSAGGQTSENIIKLKNFGNCKGCFLERTNLEGANLEGANLKGASLKNVNLEKANLKGQIWNLMIKTFTDSLWARLIRQRTKLTVQKTKKSVCTIRVIKVTVNQLETADRLDLLQ